MLEATATHGNLWKKLIDCIQALVQEANFDCSPGGFSIQAMDTSHVALVHMLLREDGFSNYQCERNCILGLNLNSLAKVLKIVEGNDSLTLRHLEGSDIVVLQTENSEHTRKSEYQLKLLEIEAEAMGIPTMEYKSVVTLSSTEFAKIVRDMTVFGDTVTISVTREGIKFCASGDLGEGYAFIRASSSDFKHDKAAKSEVKGETVKPEVKGEVKKEVVEDEDTPLIKKYETNKEGKDKTEKPDLGVEIRIEEPVNLSFALRFLNSFAKGAALSDRVSLFFAEDAPCLVEYSIEGLGYLRYYLAPKVDDGAQ
jgi:proliferating cell nuclear antigen